MYENYVKTTINRTGWICSYCGKFVWGGEFHLCPFYPKTNWGSGQPDDKGWECPKCGSVYSPTVHECWRCNR